MERPPDIEAMINQEPSRETRTCQYCQKETRASDNACYHCNYLREPEEFSQSSESRLAPAPRSVPFLLPLVYALRPKILIFSAVVGVVSLVLSIGTVGAEPLALLLVLPLLWGYQYVRAGQVLSKGVAGAARVIRKHTPFGLEGSVVMARGWQLRPTQYNGYSSKELLALKHGDGPQTVFRRGGLTGSVPYSGGYFIFDPDNPKKRVSVKDFPLVEDMFGTWSAVRPGEDGQFQVPGKVVAFSVVYFLLAMASFVVPTGLVVTTVL